MQIAACKDHGSPFGHHCAVDGPFIDPIQIQERADDAVRPVWIDIQYSPLTSRAAGHFAVLIFKETPRPGDECTFGLAKGVWADYLGPMYSKTNNRFPIIWRPPWTKKKGQIPPMFFRRDQVFGLKGTCLIWAPREVALGKKAPPPLPTGGNRMSNSPIPRPRGGLKTEQNAPPLWIESSPGGEGHGPSHR